MATALAEQGFAAHLWFVGDPELPGEEVQGRLTLHRWCQWLSRYHPAGVYDGETSKTDDFARSLPPRLVEEYLAPACARGEPVVVLAEEWHTVHSVLHLDWLLRRRGLRDVVPIFWTANNVFGFDHIDWKRLDQAAVVATVSRYMRERMRPLGVNAFVLPNGIAPEAFVPAEAAAVRDFARLLDGRTTLTKMARWDPDKHWLGAVESVDALRRADVKPLLIARGGAEAHGEDVLAHAKRLGLRVSRQPLERPGADGLLQALWRTNGSDIVVIDSHVDADARRLLFHASSQYSPTACTSPSGSWGSRPWPSAGSRVPGAPARTTRFPVKTRSLFKRTIRASSPPPLHASERTLRGNEASGRRRSGPPRATTGPACSSDPCCHRFSWKRRGDLLPS